MSSAPTPKNTTAFFPNKSNAGPPASSLSLVDFKAPSRNASGAHDAFASRRATTTPRVAASASSQSGKPTAPSYAPEESSPERSSTSDEPGATTHTTCGVPLGSRAPPELASPTSARAASASATRIASPSAERDARRASSSSSSSSSSSPSSSSSLRRSQGSGRTSKWKSRSASIPATPQRWTSSSRVAPSGSPMCAAKSEKSSCVGSSAWRTTASECASVHHAGVMFFPCASLTNVTRNARAAAPSGSSTKRPLRVPLYANASSSARRHASRTARNARFGVLAEDPYHKPEPGEF